MEVERLISDNTFDDGNAVPNVSIQGSIPCRGSKKVCAEDSNFLGISRIKTRDGVSVMIDEILKWNLNNPYKNTKGHTFSW